jgi:ABC-2 type transport system permease protein
MSVKQQNISIFRTLISVISDTLLVVKQEFKTMFKDRGVVIMFVLAPMAYPILYCSLYMNETLTNVPIAAVDCSRSQESRQFLRHLDATQNVQIVSNLSTLSEAKHAFDDKLVHGVIYIPADFSKKLNTGEQANLSIYCDISSFMYYRIINQASNNCMIDMNKQIQVKRLNAVGITGESAQIISNPIPFDGQILFNEGAGFASFLLPAILMLIIQQTLFLGIGIIAGTSRGENKFHVLVNSTVHRGRTIRVVIGKSICYLLMYGAWSFFILGVIPRAFNLPHIGLPLDIIKFMIPYLLAVVFFSMTVSVFLPHRETGMVVFLFFSLILLFLSGISWPQSNINWFWRTFAWIFPSTSGVQGYIKINTMGANLHRVSFEYVSLWIQTALYFATTCWAYRWQIKKSSKKQLLADELPELENNL